MSESKNSTHLINADSLRDKRFSGWKRLALWLGAAVVLVSALWLFDEEETVVEYKTHIVRPGNFTINVAASGTLQPRTTVKVGCEISGVLETINKDYNDIVRKGEVIARLKSDELEAKAMQLKAAVEASEARILRADAVLVEKRNEYRRMMSLRDKKAVSQKDADSAAVAMNIAVAELAVARAEVRQAKANLSEAETNLRKADIVSPIDGLVLTRHVERGQTVSTNLQTPDLFSIAAGLQQMRLELNIDEADVGRVTHGQCAVFTVDAYLGRNFTGVLEKLRFAPQRVQGVVTYVGVFAVENEDLALRPGMTASARIEIAAVRDSLVVPNSALRFRPEDKGYAESENAAVGSVWVMRGGKPELAEITKGGTNGRFTEVVGGGLTSGDEVVLSRVQPEPDSSFVLSF
ncbi:efflux RND transporter periplasmic adaptor subunit [Maridesulfovibrio sp. FT414]|uniref:efflux RND transporter periplasmic adaptor subunit n=1 Tax=Maridesulfovibrio sp. FT414 TaxID=2979469 RepID=UPI003D808CB5